MQPAEREELERVIAAQCSAREYSSATTAAIKGYGPEILGFLYSATRGDHDAADIFSDYCEKLWRGLPTFRGQSSFRTWSYSVALNALRSSRRGGARRRRRVVAMSEVPEVAAIIDHVRTRTLPHLRTEIKQAVMRLREGLDAEDQTLLILRVDRRLAWDEIALIFEPEADQDDERRRVSAMLRRRFARLKLRLRALSKDLLEGDEGT